jgi:hypothetical protein
MNKHTLQSLLTSLVMGLLLAGCGSMAFSPQQIAFNEATSAMGPGGGTTDPASVRVLQMVEYKGKTFVVTSFNVTIENRINQCLFVYGVQRSAIGSWSPFSGGGGCAGQIGGAEGPAPLPISDIGGGRSGGSGPTDPGFSHLVGLVQQDDLTRVRITWNDNSVQEVDVVNGSFFAVRAGQLDMNNIEGLNKDGEVLYNQQDPQPAPGK